MDTETRTDKASGSGKGTTIELLPTPRLNLSTVEDVRREMARVYRDMRGSRIDTQDGTRLVYVLTQILKAFEVIEFERRLTALENTQ